MTSRKTLDQMSSDDLDALHAERDQLRTAILDIDAHATPIGLADPDDPDGNPHHYAVTVGALHRALGKVGHTAAPCTAEAAITRVRALADRWDAALAVDKPYARSLRAALDEPAPITDTEDRTVCTCTFDTRCGCGTSVHYQPAPGPVAAQAADAGHVIPVDGDPAAAHEAVRQMDADTTQPHTGLVVQPYTDHGLQRWVFRCWGTSTCDGLLSLGHTSQQWAERARDRHVREEHPTEEQPMPACTATIEGPHIPGGPVHCTREAGHPENHAALAPGTDGKLMWNDHHAGATPHQASSEEQH